MSLKNVRDGGAFVRTVYAGAGAATAGGGGDNTAVNGSWVDRNQGYGMHQSAKLVISYTTALTAAQTLSFTAKLQDATSIGGAGAADLANDTIDNFAFPVTVVATGAGTVNGTVELDLNLAKAREFIRAVITPDLSNANTDTVSWQAVLLFFGADRAPITKTLA